MRNTASTDTLWDKKLKISTCAANFEKDDANHSRYEPTSYAVLERLAGSGWLNKNNILIDYGCGKGRVGFYLNHALGMHTIGIEYNPEIYAAAMKNLDSRFGKKAESSGISFVCDSAENYDINDADCFYFFNPFSEKILRTVLGKIIASYFENPRPMLLFFYYATDKYVDCLMAESALTLAGEIDCRDLFHNDDAKEKILVFKIAYEV